MKSMLGGPTPSGQATQNVKIKELYPTKCILKLLKELYLIYNYGYRSDLDSWGRGRYFNQVKLLNLGIYS